MTSENRGALLKHAKVLVCGIANAHSIAWGCAKSSHKLGANLAITYLNEKSKGYVEPIARQLDVPIFMPPDGAADRCAGQARRDFGGAGQVGPAFGEAALG